MKGSLKDYQILQDLIEEEEELEEKLNVVRTLFKKIPESKKYYVRFCFECGEVTSSADKDSCFECGFRYDPSEDGEICPQCDCDDYLNHCEKCDAELDANYLTVILYEDIKWSETELETIKNWIEKQINGTEPKE